MTFLRISIDDQTLELIRDGETLRTFRVSTAAKGTGNQFGSHRTPVGRFRISEKIGHDQSPDTIFKSRVAVGEWDGSSLSDDLILARILRLDGLETQNANTLDRFIYIHGTNHVELLGEPSSLGCIRLHPAEMGELFDLVETGIEVVIEPQTVSRGKLVFFDCDSTLSTIEGIDELARARGPEIFEKVEALTHAAMNGEVPIHEVFPGRMEIIRPDRELCDQVARRYIETVTPGAAELVGRLRELGWTPVILSGGFAPLIRPLADHLGIQHVEAVPMYLNDDGSYRDFGRDYPTTRNGGKPEVIREWKEALNPSKVIMVGDGISDMETKPEVDLFVGFGGVVSRGTVRSGADAWLEDLHLFEREILSRDEL